MSNINRKSKLYNILYIDPPWKYNPRANHKTRFRGGACGHYDTMAMEDIKKLPISNLAADNCALFMWCTFPYLADQIKLFEHFGFKYKTVAFNWVKTNAKNGFPFFGVGYYTKSNPEVCLLGIKGKMKPISNKISNVVEDIEYDTTEIIAPRQGHSVKPYIVPKLITNLFGELPRLEMFCRGTGWPGWDVYGNEAVNSIDLGDYYEINPSK